MSGQDAIVLAGVAKHFKKTARKREYTTFKSELIRVLKGQRRLVEPTTHIEALKGVDLRVPRGATLGIVGRNGSGKSTLLKLITGIYTPTSGTVQVNGRISALLELGAGFHPDFTGRENITINGIILGMSHAELKARVEDIIAFAELGDFIDEPVRTYSSGMFMRLAFAVATHVDPEILIIDEILSVGDEHFQRKSQAKMEEFKKAGKTIVLVTHSLGSLESYCDLAVWIDGGRTRMVGRPKDVVAEYQRAVDAAEREAAQTGQSALSTPGVALPGGAAEATTPVSLTAASLLDDRGQERAHFAVGEPQVMRFALEAREPRDTAVAYELRSGDGQVLWACKEQLGVLSPGPHEVRLRIPAPALSGGRFLAIASLGDGVQETWGRVDCWFEVSARDGWRGPMSVDVSWSRLGA